MYDCPSVSVHLFPTQPEPEMADVLRARNLLPWMQKRFLTASATLSPLPNCENTSKASSSSSGSFLNSALSASEKKKKQPELLLEFMKSYGFSDTHIAKVVQKFPDFLHCRVEGNLKPKFEFLSQIGFVGKLLPELVVSYPVVCRRSLDNQIKPSVVFLKSFLDSDEKVVTAMRRSWWWLNLNNRSRVQANVDLLLKERVPIDRAAKFINLHPRTLMQKHDRMVYVVNVVKSFGFKPESPLFVDAVRTILSMTEHGWKRKIEFLKSVGWSEQEISSAFRRYPLFMSNSEEKILGLLDFYANTMKLDLGIIIARPQFLIISLERIHLRYNLLEILQSKNLITGITKIHWSLVKSEKEFLKNYVVKYVDKVPGLLEIYGVNDRVKRILDDLMAKK